MPQSNDVVDCAIFVDDFWRCVTRGAYFTGQLLPSMLFRYLHGGAEISYLRHSPQITYATAPYLPTLKATESTTQEDIVCLDVSVNKTSRMHESQAPQDTL